jgi:hypothetical protein
MDYNDPFLLFRGLKALTRGKMMGSRKTLA